MNDPPPNPVPMVDLPGLYEEILPDIRARINEVLRSCQFIGGEEVGLFEREFGEYCHAGHVVGLNSGTAAIHLALWALGIGPGDEVIVPAFTFVATAEAVCAVGARPVLADVEPDTLNLDPHAARAACTSRTRALIPVHLFGQPAEMDALLELAQEKNLAIVEDACQAHGARWGKQPVGALATGGTFSFYPAKNLGAPGDGGAFVTDDADLASKVRSLADHGRGIGGWYEHGCIGGTYRMNTIPAVFLRCNLPHLDGRNECRRQAARRYEDLLEGIETVQPLTVRPNRTHVYHQYVVRCQQRDALRDFLAKHQIASGIHFPHPLHRMPALQHLEYEEGTFPVSEAASREVLSLPLHPQITAVVQQRVAETIRRFYDQKNLR